MDGTFHSLPPDTKEKFRFTFDKSGMFEYFCRLHPRVKGKVVVTP